MSSEQEHAARRDEIAQEKYGKTFEECSAMERVAVGGTLGGEARKEQMAAEHGGDVTEAYQEMGKAGGEARKEQMAAEHGGDVKEAYQELGAQRGKKEGEE